MGKYPEVDHIVTAFSRFLAQNDKSKIADFTEEELLKTKRLCASSPADRDQGWYIALIERLEELDDKKNRKFQINLTICIILYSFLGALIAKYI